MSLEYIQGMQDKVTRNEVNKQLRVALAGEFNSNHNLIMQSKLVEGYQKEEISKHLFKMHSTAREHAQLIIARILEMGGNPDIRPITWDSLAVCDYYPITETDQKDILEDVYASKTCKTQYYTGMLNFLEPRDKTTYDLINRILEEEYEGMNIIRKLQEGLLSASERIQ